jgi:hypothetical protein
MPHFARVIAYRVWPCRPPRFWRCLNRWPRHPLGSLHGVISVIKGLFFMAALLASGLAYGAGPTATLSVQVVDPAGPPSPPAPAVAAGFTTCVICFDFTAASGGVWVNGSAPAGVNAAQANTWLDCAGASSPILYHGSNPTNAANFPCQTITTDSSSTQVLQETNGGGITVLANSSWYNGLVAWHNLSHGDPGIQVPTFNYYQMTYEVPTSSSSTYVQGPWTIMPNGCGTPGTDSCTYLEFDAFEMCCGVNDGPGFNSGFGNWATQGSLNGGTCTFWGPNDGNYVCANWYSSVPPNYDSYNLGTQYLKVGMRTTSDGTSIYKCMWINDVFQNCVSSSSTVGGVQSWQMADAHSRQALVESLVGMNNGTGNPVSMPSVVGWIKNLYVWSCSAWQTTACRSSTADPGSYGGGH